MSFFKQSIDGIVADITAKIAKLNLVAEAHKLEAEVHQTEINARVKLAAFALSEFGRAKSIAQKLEALIK